MLGDVMARKVSASTWKNKATALHSRLIRDRGYCENCEALTNLQCAHIVSRRFAATRTDLDNAFCLCATCHWYFTNWPLEFATFVRTRRGKDAYEVLRKKAQSGGKVDWEAEYRRLQQIAERAA